MGKTLINNLVEFYKAGEALTARDNVYISSADGKAYKLDVTDENKRTFSGIAKDTVDAEAFVRVVQSGKVKGFTGLTPGQVVYASVTVPGSFQLEQPGSANETVIVGTARNANDLIVNASLGVPFGAGGGSGVGGVDILAVQDFESVTVNDFTQDGLVITDVSPLRGLKSAQLTHDAVDVKFFTQVIPVDKKFRGRALSLKLNVLSNSTNGNVTLTVTDETNIVNIVTDRALKANNTDSLVNVVTFNIPNNCESLSYTVNALVEASSPVTIVDDVIIELLVNKENKDSLLINPSFDNDIIEFNCVDATGDIVDSTIPTALSQKMFQMTVTGAGGYCDFSVDTNSKFVGLPFRIGGLFQTELTDLSYCTLVNGVEDNCIPIAAIADDTVDPFQQPFATQSIAGGTSVGLRIKVDTSATGVINVDKLKLELGGLPTSPTVNCESELDCANEISAVFNSGGTIISQSSTGAITSVSRVNSVVSIVLSENTNISTDPSVLINIVDDVARAAKNISYDQGTRTITFNQMLTTTGANESVDRSWNISISKQGLDAKSPTQQGAVNVGQASGALLVVNNESVTTNQTIGTSAVVIDFSDIIESKEISWDASTNTGTFLKSGRFQISFHGQVFNSTAQLTKILLSVDTGSGFVEVAGQSISLTTNSATDRQTLLTPFVYQAQAGNGFRLEAVSTVGTTVLFNSPVSPYNNFPTLTVAQVVDQQTIAASLRFPQTAYIKDVKADGVAAGTCTSGSWLTRDLNTLEGSVEGLSLGTNEFTLTSGTYEIDATSQTFGTNNHKAKLRNITDSSDEIIGSSEYSDSAGPTAHMTSSRVTGLFIVEGSKTFEIQHRCATTSSFGVNSNFGVNEVYTQVKITRLK
jgi:hypothetical protein